MEIKIIAIAPNDGWGFFEKEERIYLLHPPYTSSNLIEVSRKEVENAIHLHGFEECDISLNGINEAVKFLKEKYIESKETQGIDLPSSKQLRELLKYASDDVLLEYLNKAKRELIPEGKLDAAESIALELMKLERVNDNPEMRGKGIDILDKCSQGRERVKELEFGISNKQQETWRDRFPYVVDIYSIDSIMDYSKSIKERGHLLPISRIGA